jgi:hypothetical protein
LCSGQSSWLQIAPFICSSACAGTLTALRIGFYEITLGNSNYPATDGLSAMTPKVARNRFRFHLGAAAMVGK